jgi:hypothetical protein
MILYRVHHYTTENGSQGFVWFATFREAKADAQLEENPENEIEGVEFRANAAGVLRLLNVYAAHPDNG